MGRVSDQFTNWISKGQEMLGSSIVIGDRCVLIDAQMLVDGRPQVVGCEWAVVWVLALGVSRADHLTMLHASSADQD